MSVNLQFEDAAKAFRELLQQDTTKGLRNSNEATTRLLLIDEVLQILGWPKKDFHPEQPTTTGEYTDYRLTIEGESRLIVEAKRFGLIEALPKPLQSKEYRNETLSKSCGPQIERLLKQCRTYCTDCGVPYALATTGDIWIILVAYRTGDEWGQLRSIVFHSLNDLQDHFAEFYGLLSREAVRRNSLEERFATMVVPRPSVAIRPNDSAGHTPDIGSVTDRYIIETYFDRYMGDITAPSRQDMLEQCFVRSRQIDGFSHDLKRLLRYDAVLDEQDRPIDELDEQRLESTLELQADSDVPRTILLVGNVGAGKTTFVHRFIRVRSNPKKNICAVVNLINDAAVQVEPDRAEENRLAEFVLNEVTRQFRDELNPIEPNVLRGCFEIEIGKFKQMHRTLQEQDPAQYVLEEERHIFELSKDKYRHLAGYIRYARKKKKHVAWVAFDNVDQGSASYQRFVYSFAHRLADEAQCVTLVTLREDTFLEAQQGGFLDVRTTDVVFRLSAPEVSKVVSRRRKYVTKLIESDELPKSLKQHLKLVELLNSHINSLVLGANASIRTLLTTLSLSNIRNALNMLRRYYTSYHATFHEHYAQYKDTIEPPKRLDPRREHLRFLQALMLENSWSYREDTSSVFNLFSVDSLERTSHFLMLRLLAYLSLERNFKTARISVRVDTLVDDFIFLGYPRHQVTNAVKRLLTANLIVSPTLPMKEAAIVVPDPLPLELRIALSPKGFYYLRTMAGDSYYQARVAQDTVWYDSDPAASYMSCLQESRDAQKGFGPEDALMYTNAREVFIEYLRKSLMTEVETSNRRYHSTEWARQVEDMAEQAVFGTIVLKSANVDSGGLEADAEHAKVQTIGVLAHTSATAVHNRAQKPDTAAQLPLFETERDERAEIAKYVIALNTAFESLGPLPARSKYDKSRYVIRALWALELASRAGMGPQRARHLALIISDYGSIKVASQNMAQFFRNLRATGRYSYLWREDPNYYYSITAAGHDLLMSVMHGPIAERRRKQGKRA